MKPRKSWEQVVFQQKHYRAALSPELLIRAFHVQIWEYDPAFRNWGITWEGVVTPRLHSEHLEDGPEHSTLARWTRDKAVAIPLPAPWVLTSSGFLLLDNLHAVNESMCLGDGSRSNKLKELMLWRPQETGDMQTHFSLESEPSRPQGCC